jgi:hypothetical protein
VAALERGSVLDWLRALPEEEFAHLMAEACRGRAYPCYEATEVQFLAAQAWWNGGGPWTVELIAAEDLARYQGTPFAGGFPPATPSSSRRLAAGAGSGCARGRGARCAARRRPARRPQTPKRSRPAWGQRDVAPMPRRIDGLSKHLAAISTMQPATTAPLKARRMNSQRGPEGWEMSDGGRVRHATEGAARGGGLDVDRPGRQDRHLSPGRRPVGAGAACTQVGERSSFWPMRSASRWPPFAGRDGRPRGRIRAPWFPIRRPVSNTRPSVRLSGHVNTAWSGDSNRLPWIDEGRPPRRVRDTSMRLPCIARPRAAPPSL